MGANPYRSPAESSFVARPRRRGGRVHIDLLGTRSSLALHAFVTMLGLASVVVTACAIAAFIHGTLYPPPPLNIFSFHGC